MPPDDRRTYYDHEPAYRDLAAQGGRGWEDRSPDAGHDPYAGLEILFGFPLLPAAGARVLDLGCGGGQVSLALAARGFEVLGLDFSPSAIALARANATAAGQSVRFEVADCLDPRCVVPGTFDLVVDHHVLHCIVGDPDRQGFLGLVHRALRPGGLFFSETMSAEGELDHAHYRIDPETRVSLAGNRVMILRDELHGELGRAGLQVVHHETRIDPDDPPSGEMLLTFALRVAAS